MAVWKSWHQRLTMLHSEFYQLLSQLLISTQTLHSQGLLPCPASPGKCQSCLCRREEPFREDKDLVSQKTKPPLLLYEADSNLKSQTGQGLRRPQFCFFYLFSLFFSLFSFYHCFSIPLLLSGISRVKPRILHLLGRYSTIELILSHLFLYLSRSSLSLFSHLTPVKTIFYTFHFSLIFFSILFLSLLTNYL